MLAGRPHEAAGNGSPRWMTAARAKRGHRTRPTGRLTPQHAADLWKHGLLSVQFRCSSAGFFPEGGVDDAAAEVFGLGEQVSMVSVIEEWPSRDAMKPFA